MSIGHHIQDRGHVIEKKRNHKTGEREFNQDFQNMDECECQWWAKWGFETFKAIVQVIVKASKQAMITPMFPPLPTGTFGSQHFCELNWAMVTAQGHFKTRFETVLHNICFSQAGQYWHISLVQHI